MKDSSPEHEQENLGMVRERERQKTRRFMMFLGVFALLALFGMVLVLKDSGEGGRRKVDIDLSKGKLSLSVDKPILEQVDQPTTEYRAGSREVAFTTGSLNQDLFQQLGQTLPGSAATGFSGKNFINREVGFVLTVNHPELWQFTGSAAGLVNPMVPINSIYTADGSHLNITRDNAMGMDLNTYLAASLQQLMNLGLLADYPQVTYDYASGTAFLFFVNPYSGGASYMKVIMKNGMAYIATANYNLSQSNSAAVDDLVNMVASFTLAGQ